MRVKFKNLKTYFIQTHKKHQISKSDSQGAIPSKWYLYEYAHFLSETVPGSDTQPTWEQNSQQQVKITCNTICKRAWSIIIGLMRFSMISHHLYQPSQLCRGCSLREFMSKCIITWNDKNESMVTMLETMSFFQDVWWYIYVLPLIFISYILYFHRIVAHYLQPVL